MMYLLTQEQHAQIVDAIESLTKQLEAANYLVRAFENGCDANDYARDIEDYRAAEQGQPERAPLSDTRIEDVYRHIPDFHQWTFSAAMLKFARAIEAAHGIKQGDKIVLDK
jgi:hypothetical protein